MRNGLTVLNRLRKIDKIHKLSDAFYNTNLAREFLADAQEILSQNIISELQTLQNESDLSSDEIVQYLRCLDESYELYKLMRKKAEKLTAKLSKKIINELTQRQHLAQSSYNTNILQTQNIKNPDDILRTAISNIVSHRDGMLSTSADKTPMKAIIKIDFEQLTKKLFDFVKTLFTQGKSLYVMQNKNTIDFSSSVLLSFAVILSERLAFNLARRLKNMGLNDANRDFMSKSVDIIRKNEMMGNLIPIHLAGIHTLFSLLLNKNIVEKLLHDFKNDTGNINLLLKENKKLAQKIRQLRLELEIIQENKVPVSLDNKRPFAISIYPCSKAAQIEGSEISIESINSDVFIELFLNVRNQNDVIKLIQTTFSKTAFAECKSAIIPMFLKKDAHLALALSNISIVEIAEYHAIDPKKVIVFENYILNSVVDIFSSIEKREQMAQRAASKKKTKQNRKDEHQHTKNSRHKITKNDSFRKIPATIKTHDFKKLISKLGVKIQHVTGSHHILEKRDKRSVISIHPGQDILSRHAISSLSRLGIKTEEIKKMI